jgi:NifU-like protein involved in Fe-S cluster formation
MSQAEILREAFFNRDKVLKSNDDLKSYLAGYSKNQTGMNVKVFIKLETDSIHDARYQVSGCPHLIGLTSILIKKIIGHDIAILQEYDYLSLAEAVDLPKNKKDRLFLLEDAVKDCIKHIEQG